MNFVKMHGLGNDFVLIDGRELNIESILLNDLAKELCDRHFGIGADGLMIVLPSEKANYRMRIFNPDGSEAEMCGNGIRCFAKYVYEKDKLQKDVISVETLAGIMVPALLIEKGILIGAEVDMGAPEDQGEIKMHGHTFRKISMGNPHAVAFVPDLEEIDLTDVGQKVENDPHFKNRTNVEFVKVISDRELDVRVWERGAGETQACGTGACAAVVAGVLTKKTNRRVLVHLPGGNLDVEWEEEDNHVALRGPAKKVFEGKYHTDLA
ncbi:MAG: diaminopimelate epimerase [Candidatus Saganbacteria bacterium]|nr:diaminopimelate epimerase [Candidatus Saganbacteria bacterium]